MVILHRSYYFGRRLLTITGIASNVAKMDHELYITVPLYSANDHSLHVHLTYNCRLGVEYGLECIQAEDIDPCNIDFSTSYGIDFVRLSRRQMLTIAKGEVCVCGNLQITVDDHNNTLVLKRNDYFAPYKPLKITIPRTLHEKVKREITRVVDDADLMERYISPGIGYLVVDDPKAQRIMVLACLHSALRGDDWERWRGVHDYLDDEVAMSTTTGNDFVANAARMVDTLTAVDVNNILKGSGCQISHEAPEEPIVKSLFSDRDRVITNLLYGRLSPSGEYFAHFARCPKARHRSERVEM